MNDLNHVIKTLLNLQSQINLIVETLNEIGNNHGILSQIPLNNFFNQGMNLENSTHTLLSNYSIVMFCSFIDEYEKNFNISFLKSVDPERIKRVKIKNNAGLKRIKKWKDLHNFRSFIVAHNFRKSNGKSFFSDEFENFTFKIPNTISEKRLFLDITFLICQNLKVEFPEIFNSLDSNELMLNKMKIIGEKIDHENEIMELIEKMK